VLAVGLQITAAPQPDALQETKMPTKTLEQIEKMLPKLAPDDQDSVLGYIEFLSGDSVLDQLSPEDHSELERRATDAETQPMVPFRDAIAGIRQRLTAKS
jgi:hypothetical protein